MEFLGDSILGSIVSSYLYERFYKIYKQDERSDKEETIKGGNHT